MKKLSLALLLLLSCLPVFAACHAVGPTATGSGSGADYNNLMVLTATPVRGDLYYLVDGNYGPTLHITTANSGSTTIEIRKAQSYDFGSGCGIGAGWNTGTMGSAQAVWQANPASPASLISITGFIILNGNGQDTISCGSMYTSPTATNVVAPTNPASCGLKFDDSTCTSTGLQSCGGGGNGINRTVGTHPTIEYTEMFGNGGRGTNMANAGGTFSNENYWMWFQSVDGATISNNYYHNMMTTYVLTNGGVTNLTITKNIFWGLYDSTSLHSEAIQVQGTNAGPYNISDNYLIDQTTNGDVVVIGAAGGNLSNLNYWNNIDVCLNGTASNDALYGTTCNHTQGMLGCINSGCSLTNSNIFGNTMAQVGGGSGSGTFRCGTANSTGGTVTNFNFKNNLFYNCTAFQANNTSASWDFNSYLNSHQATVGANDVSNASSPNPFVGLSTPNLNLASDNALWNNRTSLGSPYDTDFNNVTFTTDRGAYQFVSGTPTAASPTCSPVAGTYTGTQNITLTTTSPGAIMCQSTSVTPATNGVSGCTSGTLVSGTVPISVTSTLQAVAGGTGYLDSSVTSCSYTINSPLTVSADYANRTGGATIPVNWQGANTMSHLDSTSTTTLLGAGIKVSREFIDLHQVWLNCPSPCTPDYTSIDGITSLAASRGFKVIISIEYTPPDLGASLCTPPSSNTTWATRAAAAIAHVDGLHSGLVLAWEVGNEYDLSGQFCPAGTPGTNLATYLPLYAAAAQAMITQVTTDGQSALVGGPVLGAPGANAAAWLANTSTGLLGNVSTKGLVQFVSWHQYIGGCTTTWTACFNALQNASTGQNALANSINTLVIAGGQPNPTTTPIYVDEYNDSSAFSSDSVRNDATNGPLWNAVFITNALSQTRLPQLNGYYAAASSGSGNFFCLVGNTSLGDCSQPPLNPYPQFYLYQLLFSTKFLGLIAGGHLAGSVTPGSSTTGLQSAAFYTPSADVMLLANPTSTPINSQTVTFTNSGFGSTTGVQYLLNASNSTITASPFSGTVNIPANSTVGIIISPGSTKVTPGNKITPGAVIQ